MGFKFLPDTVNVPTISRISAFFVCPSLVDPERLAECQLFFVIVPVVNLLFYLHERYPLIKLIILDKEAPFLFVFLFKYK